MKLSCGIAPRPDAPDLAALAEQLGYERAWFYDSPALYGDVWSAMARTLDRTERIGVGTAVLIPSLRHPMVTAAAIGSLEAQAPGRLVVAIGTGFTGRRCFGQDALPWKAVEHWIRSVQALLRGEDVEIEGRVCRMLHPQGAIAKRPIETPLVVAANGPKGLAVAEAVGSAGIMCAGVVPEGARDVRLLSFGTVLDEGESFATPAVLDRIGAGIAVIYHGTYEAAGAAAVDALPGGKGWREEIEQVPEAVRHLSVHEGHFWEPSDRDRRHISSDLGAATFSGTREQLRARAADLEAQGVCEIVYAAMGPDVPRELRAMAEAIGGA